LSSSTALYTRKQAHRGSIQRHQRTQSGFYLAKDAKIFEKHGLYVDPVYVAGASRIQQAMIAGEFTLALAAAMCSTVNLQAVNVVIIGGV